MICESSHKTKCAPAADISTVNKRMEIKPKVKQRLRPSWVEGTVVPYPIVVVKLCNNKPR